MTVNDIVQNYLEGASAIADLLVELNTQVDDHNMSLSDLDHFLELENMSYEEGLSIMAMRKESLVARRKAKDNARVIDCILPKQIEGRTTKDRYDHALHSLSERGYTPRKLKLETVLNRES